MKLVKLYRCYLKGNFQHLWQKEKKEKKSIDPNDTCSFL